MHLSCSWSITVLISPPLQILSMRLFGIGTGLKHAFLVIAISSCVVPLMCLLGQAFPEFVVDSAKGPVKNTRRELSEQLYLYAHMARDSRVLFIGGNIGTGCVLADKLLREPAQSTCVEPSPNVVPILQQNRQKHGASFSILSKLLTRPAQGNLSFVWLGFDMFWLWTKLPHVPSFSGVWLSVCRLTCHYRCLSISITCFPEGTDRWPRALRGQAKWQTFRWKVWIWICGSSMSWPLTARDVSVRSSNLSKRFKRWTWFCWKKMPKDWATAAAMDLRSMTFCKRLALSKWTARSLADHVHIIHFGPSTDLRWSGGQYITLHLQVFQLVLHGYLSFYLNLWPPASILFCPWFSLQHVVSHFLRYWDSGGLDPHCNCCSVEIEEYIPNRKSGGKGGRLKPNLAPAEVLLISTDGTLSLRGRSR